MQSLDQVSEKLESDLQQYIEATYHLRHPRLLRERRALMENDHTATEPWVEATPKYESGQQLRDLGLPTSVTNLLKDLEADGLDIFDPPYKHQAEALQAFFNDEDDLIVSTGTGSGKTEIFLYSILGQLALEADRNQTTTDRGIRTLVLYPMNALVADQLSRVRQMFGDSEGATTIESRFGRRVQFGMYTGQTPYPSKYETDRNDRVLKPVIDRYLELKQNQPKLYNKLHEEGRIPAKDLEGFRNRGALKERHFRTQPGDTELFTRQEMHSPNEHGGTPDILITNYSMLEYMLLRPIEQPLFRDTKSWLEADEDNELNIVLDEAHLYRGAQGAEVSLLLNRLLQKLGVSRDRVRFILTSATMGKNIEEAAPDFAAQLTAANPDDFAVIQGQQISYGQGKTGSEALARQLTEINYQLEDLAPIKRVAEFRGWDRYDTTQWESVQQYLGDQLQDDELFKQTHAALRDEPEQLSDLVETLFPDVSPDIAEEATGNFLYLCTEAREDGQAILPSRLHMFLKGLPAQYVCVNPNCGNRRAIEGEKFLGAMYLNPHTTCPDCGSRVFELLSHRTCGAAYLRVYRRPNGTNRGSTFLWTDPGEEADVEEVHLLAEQPRSDDDVRHEDSRSLADTTPSRYLNIKTGHLVDERVAQNGESDDYIEVWIPTEEPPSEEDPWSWTRCPACGIKERRYDGKTKIEDLETKGEEPFANLTRSMFGIQPKDPDKSHLPNAGRKVLGFSDGRQKAARLARDLQANIELDAFREVVTDIIGSTETTDELTLDRLFAEFTIYCRTNNIVFFDDSDERTGQEGTEYEGSRSHFQDIQDRLDEIAEDFLLESIEEIPEYEPARQALSNRRPEQFDEVLLRSLGDQYYSFPALLIGYLKPIDSVVDNIASEVSNIDRELLESVLIQSVRHACTEHRAFDEDISRRRRAESYPYTPWIDPDEEGVPMQQIIPSSVKETVGDTVSKTQWRHLARALLTSDPGLFEPLGNGNYVVNPAATTIGLRLDEEWFRCDGCYRFAVTPLDGKCPHDNCMGTMSKVGPDDIHLQARKGFYRNPPRDVLLDDRTPLTIRSEEHTAQLNAKDDSDAFARSEEYELLFQDILIGESVDQPIDVLSCTTTMEVGIDIGSITGVAMRTVPPAPENYEQRAGRAGRRGTGLSTIVTFADNSPHESYHFNHPQKMITGEGSEPIIYTENEKIAKRHINASLLALYFDPSMLEESADVFSALSTTQEFFGNHGKQTLSGFQSWLEQNIFTDSSDHLDHLGGLLPDGLDSQTGITWRREFVRQTAREFISDLEDLQESTNWDEMSDADENLLSVLLDAALLPTFSFPTDVCDFVVPAWDDNANRPVNQYEMSRDLKQALSTYVPGREIVVDKKTFESYGVYFKFADDPVDRAAGEEWDELDWLNWCPVCETVFEETDKSLNAEGVGCPVCGESVIESLQKYRPKAFAPEVDQTGTPEEGETGYDDDDRVYATSPRYPLTTTAAESDDPSDLSDIKSIGESTVGRANNEELLVTNFGPDEDGFEVCTDCGAVSPGGELDNPHNRPYPKDKRFLGEYDWDDQCSGATVRTSFSHSFRSDLTVFRIPLTEQMNFDPAAEWFETACQSLVEAIVMGASRALGIKNNELEGGYRTRSTSYTDAADVHGIIELFVFDTTPGGAGFSSRVWQAFEDVLGEARDILTSCSCESACHDCLQRYENRHIHDILDRHQGLALLEYARTGTPPVLSHEKVQALMSQLETSLQLERPDITVEHEGAELESWTAKHSHDEFVFGVRSALRASRENQSAMLDADYSAYQLSQNLPEVAHEIIDELV